MTKRKTTSNTAVSTTAKETSDSQDDRVTRYAFLFLMGVLSAGFLYVLVMLLLMAL